MQVQNLIDYFELLANTHTKIKSFGTGDLFEVAIAGEDEYIQLWLEQIFQASETRGLVSWNLAFIVHKIQKQDETNENVLLDTLFTIGQEVIQKIRNDKIFIVDESINTVSFTEGFEDFTCGWRFELTLKSKSPLNICTLDNAFDLRCDYSGDAGDSQSTFFTKVLTNLGVLNLPTLPIDITDTLGANANATSLENDLINLGYDALVSFNIIVGKGTYVQYTIEVFNTLALFLCLETDASSKMFTANCDCFFLALPVEDLLGDIIEDIFVDDEALNLPSLPFDYSMANSNFEVDRKALEDGLKDLGYEAEVLDITPASPIFGRELQITISSTADNFTVYETNLGDDDFEFLCN